MTTTCSIHILLQFSQLWVSIITFNHAYGVRIERSHREGRDQKNTTTASYNNNSFNARHVRYNQTLLYSMKLVHLFVSLTTLAIYTAFIYDISHPPS